MIRSPLPLVPCLLALAACAAAPVARLAPTPLGLPPAPVRIEAARADADRSPATPGAPSPFVHDPAVRALYGATMPAAAVAPVAVEPTTVDAVGAADASTTYRYYDPYAVYEARRAREPFVPAATIFGAGLGAALSHCGHRGEGALLGAGIGLLFDLQRASR